MLGWNAGRPPALLASLATASGIPEAADALVDYDADRLHPLDATGKILWLLDHFRDLTLTAIAEVVGVDLGFISRVAKKRGRQSRAAKERKGARLAKGERVWVEVN